MPRDVSVGTHPNWLPEMVCPAAAPLPAKLDAFLAERAMVPA
jgi:hypothetical protein